MVGATTTMPVDPLSTDLPSSVTASSSKLHLPTAGAESDYGFDDISFDNYCIVCDRLIAQPIEPEAVVPPTTKQGKKKAAGGKITVKNPDGSTTTRSANGTKTTRPGLKRNTSSANRLAAVAAANSTTVKLHPLTRSKTADPPPTHSTLDQSSTDSSISPRSAATASPEKQFRSSIYCSRECAREDAGRSTEAYKQLSRTFSHEFTHPNPPFASGEHGSGGVYVNDHSPDANAPPSPLFISGSDTDSSTAGGPDGPACSAPKTLEYFRMSKDGPDDAWRAHQRQRRSSMHPSIAPVPMARQLSSHSSVQRGFSGMSSDSLSSLWNMTATEADLDALARTTSHTGQSERGPRKSISSDRSVPIPSRGISRSNLSQTSLVNASPTHVSGTSGEVGSASSQAISLLQGYAIAFQGRDSGRNSISSTSYKGPSAAFPSSFTPSSSRRESLSVTPQVRPDVSTIRARRSESSALGGAAGRGATTWDEYGWGEVEANNARAAARAKARRSADASVPAQTTATNSEFGLSVPVLGGTVGSGSYGTDITPKQSLEVENGKWKVKYSRTPTSPAIPTSSASAGSGNSPHGTATATGTSMKANGTLRPLVRTSKSVRSPSIMSGTSSSSDEDHHRVSREHRAGSATVYASPDAAAGQRPALPRSRSDDPQHPTSTSTSLSSTGHSSTSTSTSTSTATGTATGNGMDAQAMMPPPSTIPLRTNSSAGLVRLDTPSPRSNPVDSVGSFGRLLNDHNTPKAGPMPDISSLNLRISSPPGPAAPRGGFDWSEHEKKGGKTYELPLGLKIDRNKAGLFYFN